MVRMQKTCLPNSTNAETHKSYWQRGKRNMDKIEQIKLTKDFFLLSLIQFQYILIYQRGNSYHL